MSRSRGGALDRVKSLLGLDREVPRAAARMPAGAKSRRGARVEGAGGSAVNRQDRQAFEERLTDFVAQRDAAEDLLAGKVHLINIHKIRERMGGRWSKFAERVHGLIKAELKRRLTARDFFAQVNADTYAIVFGGCSEVEARLKVALLSEQILEKLFGEAEAKDLDVLGVETLVTKIGGGLAVEALESTESLLELLDRADVTELDPNTHRYQAAAAGKRALIPNEVLELLGEVDDQLKAYETTDGGPGAPQVRVDRLRDLVRQLENLEWLIAWEDPPAAPTPAPRNAPDPCAWVEFRRPAEAALRRLKARAEQQIAFVHDCAPPADEAPAEETPVDAERSFELDFSYLPMWHAPTQRIGIYRCRTRLTAYGLDALQTAPAAPDCDADLLAVLDRMGLRQVQQDLQRRFDEGRFGMVAVPIHLSTLERLGSRRRIVELCSRIPDDLRAFLIWEILGAQDDSWRRQVAAATRHIRKFARTIFLRVPQARERFSEIERNLRYLRTAGVREIGLDVATLEGSEAENLDLLERLAVAAKANRLECYGHGFESLSMTICAVCLGYQHVSGPAIAAPVDRPGGIRATAMETIYGRVAGTGAVAG